MKALPLAAAPWLIGLALALAAVDAQAQTTAAPTTITVAPASPSSAKGQLVLSAKLASADGKALSDERIDFYVPNEVFGSRESFVGSGTTDSTGVASIGYQPAEAGKQTIVARFIGDASYATSEATGEIVVREVVPAIKTEPLPFAGLRDWLPVGLLALVIIVWRVLLGVFLGTVQGIRRAA